MLCDEAAVTGPNGILRLLHLPFDSKYHIPLKPCGNSSLLHLVYAAGYRRPTSFIVGVFLPLLMQMSTLMVTSNG